MVQIDRWFALVSIDSGDGMARTIKEDRSAAELRAYARRTASPRAAARAYVVANVLEGMTTAKAERLAGMER